MLWPRTMKVGVWWQLWWCVTPQFQLRIFWYYDLEKDDIKTLGGCLLLLLLLLLLLEPLSGVHQLRTQDHISLFLVLLVELQIKIQYNTILESYMSARFNGPWLGLGWAGLGDKHAAQWGAAWCSSEYAQLWVGQDEHIRDVQEGRGLGEGLSPTI